MENLFNRLNSLLFLIESFIIFLGVLQVGLGFFTSYYEAKEEIKTYNLSPHLLQNT